MATHEATDGGIPQKAQDIVTLFGLAQVWLPPLLSNPVEFDNPIFKTCPIASTGDFQISVHCSREPDVLSVLCSRSDVEPIQ
jgi:hypothetical protein